MRPMMVRGVAMAALGMAFAATTVPASAQIARPQTAAGLTTGTELVEHVQWRRHGHWGPGYRGGRYYRYHRGPSGAAVGAGIAAGIIGLGIAAAAASSPPPPVYVAPGDPVYVAPGDPVAYCMQRFRSYDPASGTYLGYDGLRHPCP